MLLRISVPGRLPRSPVATSSRSAQKGSLMRCWWHAQPIATGARVLTWWTA